MTEERNSIEDLDPCPDDEVLQFYSEGRKFDPRIVGAVRAHLEFCTACRRKLSELRASSVDHEELVMGFAKRLKERQDILGKLAARGNVPGSIWRTRPESQDELFGPMVVILKRLDHSPTGLVRVAEVSEAIDQALDTDLLLSPQESGLSFPFMVRSENAFDTEFGSLKTFVGQLPPMLVRRIIWFYNSSERFDDNVPLSQYVFFKDSKGTTFMQRRHITSGLPATSDDDPRIAQLESERDQFYYLRLKEFGVVIDLCADKIDLEFGEKDDASKEELDFEDFGQEPGDKDEE
jgi:hypothetical protein